MLTAATIVALFAEDLRISVFSISTDTSFWTLYILLFTLFTLEIALSCYARPAYLFGFYFWLDVLSTASLLLDVGWIVSIISYVIDMFERGLKL